VGLQIATSLWGDQIDRFFGGQSNAEKEATEAMEAAAKAMEAAAREQEKLIDRIREPLSGLDAAAQLTSAGRQ